MNKLPTKQIYLLSIIVFGIITLSVYSTYSIFTLESVSDDIVSIHTPSNLSVYNNTYEYQQVSVQANSFVTTDLDIYNNTSNDLCYGVWYKVLSNNIDEYKVNVYQDTELSLTTNSVISAISNRRISLIITNDNDSDVKVNIGLIYSENSDTCELNISDDKLQVSSVLNNYDNLADSLISNVDKKDDEDDGYLTYKNVLSDIVMDGNNKIYVSDSFEYTDELFTLNKIKNDENIDEFKEISVEELTNYLNYYTCLDKDKCNILYHINDISEKNDKYIISDYDILVGYLNGESGIRKINNDYYYYGDNPDNFVYYNCKNELDNKTCELWRIIGFIYDDDKYITKLIKNDSIGKYKYDDSKQIWDNSEISKYLNNDYKINNGSTIKEFTFKQENIIDLDINLDEIKYLNNNNNNNNKVLLMSLSDYLNTSICDNRKINEYKDECIKNNWLNDLRINSEYTLSVKYQDSILDEEGNEVSPIIDDIVYTVGNEFNDVNVTNELDIRPVVYLSNRTFLIDGNGTIDNPYILR